MNTSTSITINKSCQPQNDLDCYYNKKWRNENKLKNKDVGSIDNFTILDNEVNTELYNLIIDTEVSLHNPVQNNLTIFRDSFYNANDKSPTISYLIKMIKNIYDIPSLANVVSIFIKSGLYTFFTLSLIAHHKMPLVYALRIDDMILSVTSKEEFEDQETIDNMIDMLNKIYPFVKNEWHYESVNFVRNVSLCEIMLSKSLLSMDESRDMAIIYNSDTYADFIAKYDHNIFWNTILNNYMGPDCYVSYANSRNLHFFKNFLNNLNDQDLDMIKDYMVYCVLRSYGPYLSIKKDLALFLNMDINEKNILVQTCSQCFGYYFDDIYHKNHYNAQKEHIVRSMFKNMVEYCRMIFEKSDFFSDTTRQQALKKINTLQLVLGKQEYTIDLSYLPVLTHDLFANLAIISNFYVKHMFKMINKPINRKYISLNNDIYSFIINAYYDPPSNSVYVPTSILNDIFISTQEDEIYNYGSIGIILGHEITHCFDNYGALFNYAGMFKNWWTSKDYAKYNNELDKVKRHYAMYRVNGKPLNSDASISENISDIGGTKISLRTYLWKHMNIMNPKTFNEKQKEYLKIFFKRWAHTLRSNIGTNDLSYEITYDVHSPAIIRINAPFSHLYEYYTIYNVDQQDFNYLDPSLRTIFLDL